MYVQDRLAEHADIVHHLIANENGRAYVCGSLAMGGAVRHVLKEILGLQSFDACVASGRLVMETW